MSFHIPSQPKTATAVAQSIGVIAASSSVQSAGQESQVTGQASETNMSFHVPSQPKTATAVAQSIGVIAASSSAQSDPVAIDNGKRICPNPFAIKVSENGGELFMTASSK